jgi:hypothetical protein
MTRTKDAVDEARARMKQMAARLLAQKEALERERGQAEQELDRVREIDTSGEGAERGLREAELSQIAGELVRRIAVKDEEIARVAQYYDETLAELKELGQVEQDAERAEVRAIVDSTMSSDTPTISPVDRALENVRTHIADLDAQARLGSEISPDEPKPSANTSPNPREAADARARQQLEALKAKRKKREGGDGGEGEEGEDHGGTTPEGDGRPKRTL